jgi:hypothetical protein
VVHSKAYIASLRLANRSELSRNPREKRQNLKQAVQMVCQCASLFMKDRLRQAGDRHRPRFSVAASGLALKIILVYCDFSGGLRCLTTHEIGVYTSKTYATNGCGETQLISMDW